MPTRLEHANIAVRDVDGMIQFLQIAFPDFAIRGEGKNLLGNRGVNIGNPETYIAVNEAPQEPPSKRVDRKTSCVSRTTDTGCSDK